MKTQLQSLILLISLLSLTGCDGLLSRQMPTVPGWTMTKAYQAALNGTEGGSLTTISQHQTATAHRLTNPDITLFIYPHYAVQGATQVFIPAYQTTFPLYETVQYEN